MHMPKRRKSVPPPDYKLLNPKLGRFHWDYYFFSWSKLACCKISNSKESTKQSISVHSICIPHSLQNIWDWNWCQGLKRKLETPCLQISSTVPNRSFLQWSFPLLSLLLNRFNRSRIKWLIFRSKSLVQVDSVFCSRNQVLRVWPAQKFKNIQDITPGTPPPRHLVKHYPWHIIQSEFVIVSSLYCQPGKQ